MNSPPSTDPVPAPATADTNETDAQSGALRLQLDQHRSTLRSVDGAWWPYGRDVTAEVTQLVMGAEHLVGRIDRVALHAGEWPDHPRRIRLGSRMLPLGFFTTGASRVSLVCREGDDIVLLVIPPTATATEAAAATARAVDSDDRSQPSELLANPEGSHQRNDGPGRSALMARPRRSDVAPPMQ